MIGYLIGSLIEDAIDYIENIDRSRDIPLIEDIPPGYYDKICKVIDNINEEINQIIIHNH